MLIQFLLFAFSINLILTSGMIKLDYNKNDNKASITFGFSNKPLLLSMDITTDISWIVPEAFDEESFFPNSITLKNKVSVIKQRNQLLSGKEIQSMITLFDHLGKYTFAYNFQYYFFTEIPPSYIDSRNSLALGSTFSNDHYSLIHLLKKNGNIDRLAFSLINEPQDAKYIYLGGVPPESIETKYHSYCNVIGRKAYWDCSISDIVIRNASSIYTYPMSNDDDSNYAYFDTNQLMISAPKSFLNRLYDTYFKEALESSLCNLREHNGGMTLECFFNLWFQLGEISFHIGDYEYEMMIMNLWKCNEDLCFLSIKENLNGNHWIFGSEFLKEFQVLFEYDNKRVSFYSKKGVKLFNGYLNSHQTQKSMICIVIIVLLFGIGILITNKYSWKKSVN